MSKPLELVVYPPLEPDDKLLWRDTSTGRQYSAPMYRHPSGIIGNQPPHPREYGKRLTGAELAAEYWRSVAQAERVQHVRAPFPDMEETLAAHIANEKEVLHRFATHPHHDEDNDEGLT